MNKKKDKILETIKSYTIGFKNYRHRISFNQSAYFQAIRNLSEQYKRLEK